LINQHFERSLFDLAHLALEDCMVMVEMPGM